MNKSDLLRKQWLWWFGPKKELVIPENVMTDPAHHEKRLVHQGSPCEKKYKLSGTNPKTIIIDDPWNENEKVDDEKKRAWKPKECEYSGSAGT